MVLKALVPNPKSRLPVMYFTIARKDVMPVVYFDQLLGAALTHKLVETFFSALKKL